MNDLLIKIFVFEEEANENVSRYTIISNFLV